MSKRLTLAIVLVGVVTVLSSGYTALPLSAEEPSVPPSSVVEYNQHMECVNSFETDCS
jgi:hypothetical protein